MGKRKADEIKVISASPTRRPYASQIAIVLGEGHEFGFDGEACLLTDEMSIVRITPSKDKHKQEGKRLQKLVATVEGFANAGKAEQMGLRLSLAVLWSAVSMKCPLKLEYHTPQPCMVYDRSQRKGGLSMTCYGTLHLRSNANKIAELINQVFSKDINVDPKLLISMELFASARLESTERARFIGLVSSLEPLASPISYHNQDIGNVVSNFITQLNSISSIPEHTRNSIAGRARNLCSESVSQAIARFVKTYFPNNPQVVESVKQAYHIRSNILHEGVFDAELDEKSRELEDIIRHIYSGIIGLDLLAPVNL